MRECSSIGASIASWVVNRNGQRQAPSFKPRALPNIPHKLGPQIAMTPAIVMILIATLLIYVCLQCLPSHSCVACTASMTSLPFEAILESNVASRVYLAEMMP